MDVGCIQRDVRLVSLVRPLARELRPQFYLSQVLLLINNLKGLKNIFFLLNDKVLYDKDVNGSYLEFAHMFTTDNIYYM